jgi:hypothetical protein
MIIVVSKNEVVSVITRQTAEEVIRDLCLARDLPQPSSELIKRSINLDGNFIVCPGLWVCQRETDEDNEKLTMYLYETPYSANDFLANSDEEALTRCPKDAYILYKESPTENGLPFINLFDRREQEEL